MENILDKIKEFRKKKGYTYETMAHELNTSPGIESNKINS
jgi:DNA-binding XRE family transcriptional regulator